MTTGKTNQPTTGEAAERDGEGTSTLGDVSHTNPYTGEAFGDTQTYSRGKVFAADGGSPDDETPDAGRLKDVDHTPPGAADGVQAVYDRGYEER